MLANFIVVHLIAIDSEIHFLLIGCGDIEVTSNLETQQCRMGVYKIQSLIFNHKPVFKHETRDQYLYYIHNENGFWMVNKVLRLLIGL